MRNLHWFQAILISALPLLTGCSADELPGAQGGETGRLSLTVSVDPSLLPASRAPLSEIVDGLTQDDFTVRLTGEDGVVIEQPFAEVDGSLVKAGVYQLQAYCGEEGAQGFDKPFFMAEEEIEIRLDRETKVALTATLANSAIVVNCTEAFRAYMTEYSVDIRSGADEEKFNYPADATDPLFINAGQASVYVSFTTILGRSASLKVADFEAQPRTQYAVTINVNDGQVGDAALTVTFDDSAVAEEREFLLNDDLFACPEPTISPEGFEYEFIEGNGTAKDAAFTLQANGGLEQVMMNIESPWLESLGCPRQLDLMKATTEQQSVLTAAGLKVNGLWRNPDRMALVDFTEVINGLHCVAGTDNVTKITLEVADRFGQVSAAPAMITVNVVAPEMTYESQDKFYVGEESVTIQVAYNGADLGNAMTARYYDSSLDIWRSTPVTSVAEQPAGRAIDAKHYDVTVALPAGDTDLKVGIHVYNQPWEEITITRDVPEFAVALKNAFATHAIFEVSSPDTDPATLARRLVAEVQKTGEGAFSRVASRVEGQYITLTGLADNSSYTAKFSVRGKESSVEFATEAATQLANAGMESWFKVDGASQYWWVSYPGESTETIWGTLNQLTTSEGGDRTAGGNLLSPRNGNGAAFSASSGTEQTSDAHSGSSAARLETLGWGGSNRAKPLILGSVTVGHINAAELYLGKYDETSKTANYGMEFASRPQGLTFWYKYTPADAADYGYAEITVSDAEGNVLATATTHLEATGVYAQKTLSLNYSESAAKAGKLSVVFRSTENPDCLVTGKLKTDVSSFADRFSGSVLLVDDITLNY